MNRTKRLGRLGGRAAATVAATLRLPLVWQVGNAKQPPSAAVRLDMAIWMAVFAMPAMLAAWLLAGLVAAGRDPGVGAGRPRPAAGGRDRDSAGRPARLGHGHGGRADPGPGRRGAVAVRGRLRPRRRPPARQQPGGDGRHRGTAVAARPRRLTAAALPAGRVFGPVFVGLVGGLATLMVARPRRAGEAGSGAAVGRPGRRRAGTGRRRRLVAFTTYYLVEPLLSLGGPPAR